MARKTVDVDAVRTMANDMLAKSLPNMTAEREGIAHLLEHVLHASGNYRGFAYRGVVWTNDIPTIPDETRRFYN